MPAAIRRHYAKKEATEHMQAQNALARGDMKAWHKHESKAHKAGSHARHGGLMHTDYMMTKENLPPVIVPNEPPMMPTMSMSHTMSQGAMSPFLQPLPPQMGPIEVAENSMPDYTVIEPGTELEPTIVVEPMFVEEARTVVEYGEPIAAVVHMEPMVYNRGMGMGVGAAMASMSGMEEVVQYGDMQFMGETVTGL